MWKRVNLMESGRPGGCGRPVRCLQISMATARRTSPFRCGPTKFGAAAAWCPGCRLAGRVAEKAFIRDLQWDTYGTRVLHLDLTRFRPTNGCKSRSSVELRGTAIGAKEGGNVEQVVHDVEIECLATEIPEKLLLRIGGLKLEGSLTASAIELPPGVTLVSDPDELVVHCVKPARKKKANRPPAKEPSPK